MEVGHIVVDGLIHALSVSPLLCSPFLLFRCYIMKYPDGRSGFVPNSQITNGHSHMEKIPKNKFSSILGITCQVSCQMCFSLFAALWMQWPNELLMRGFLKHLYCVSMLLVLFWRGLVSFVHCIYFYFPCPLIRLMSVSWSPMCSHFP